MREDGLIKLLTKEGRKGMFIMHVVGTLSVLAGLILHELGIVTMWVSLVGFILWGIAEGQLLRALKEEIDGLKG